MAIPTLSPKRTTSAVVLPSTGSLETASDSKNYHFGIYAVQGQALYDTNFAQGASDQVSYTYKKLGGDVLDIELTVGNIYTAYEEAVLEYSYLVNVHQAKNSLSSMLGGATGSFDSDGMLQTDPASSLTNQEVSLKYPRFNLGYSKRIGDSYSTETGIGGTETIYSASINVTSSVQDYDLQQIIYAQNPSAVGKNEVTVRKVMYKTPHAMWRFYGYYGGLNTVGNMSTYGMYADDSTFEVIPTWQNKLQAMAYEDAIYTRVSHYSYEIKNNKLRLYPQPTSVTVGKMWVEYTVHTEAWEEDGDRKSGASGINNMNTLPFANIPYKNINSIGKQWIRRFALALAKEMLAQVRGKFSSIPIPGNDLQLNASDLMSQSQGEQQALREELKAVLDELTYKQMTTDHSTMAAASNEAKKHIPMGIYHG